VLALKLRALAWHVERQMDTQGKATSSTVRDVAKRHGLGIATVWREIKRGRLVAVHCGSRTLILDAHERAWLEAMPRRA
jgi:transposase